MKDTLLLKKFHDFIQEQNNNPLKRSIWIYGDYIKVYLRNSKRCFDKKTIVDCIDIATIEVYDEKNFRKGLFTTFLKEVENVVKDKIIYIENVMDPHFANFFVKQGYQKIGDDFLPCFYKEK